MSRQKVQELISEIDSLIEHKFDDLQDWRTLYDWPLNETRRIGNTINTKVYHSETELRFLTVILPGGGFDEHWHDIAELCRVIAGLLKDLVSGQVWRRDDVAIFSRGQKHIPVNPDETNFTYLEVRFQK